MLNRSYYLKYHHASSIISVFFFAMSSLESFVTVMGSGVGKVFEKDQEETLGARNSK